MNGNIAIVALSYKIDATSVIFILTKNSINFTASDVSLRR
jgi:hypothetical protein